MPFVATGGKTHHARVSGVLYVGLRSYSAAFLDELRNFFEKKMILVITPRVNSLIMGLMMMVDVHTTRWFATGFFL
ncbi:MAG: hypothetical protein WBA43_19925, partial [Elainellaceae cyanobacterium]